MVTPTNRRTGFTLIELLVVIALIATLAALSAGAFFRVRAGQTKAASEATLNKLGSALENRLSAIREKVNEEARTNSDNYKLALSDAGGNPDVAKSLLLYAKVKNELPMSFDEAKTDTVVGSIILRRRENFRPLYTLASPNTPEESAICFYLAVTTSGGGGAMTDGEGLQQQTMESPSFPGLKVFKDAWGTPIAFVRQAYPDEVNGGVYVRSGQVRDPFDPSNKLTTSGLMTSRWPVYIASFPTWAVPSGVAPFSSAPTLTNLKTVYPGARNFTSTLISAGPDKQFFKTSEYDVYGGTNNDNLLGYRLRRQDAKGD